METVNAISGEISGNTDPTRRNRLQHLHSILNEALALLDAVAASLLKRKAKRGGTRLERRIVRRLKAIVRNAVEEAGSLKTAHVCEDGAENQIALENAFALLYCASTAISDAMYEEGSWGAEALARGLTASVDGIGQVLQATGMIELIR